MDREVAPAAGQTEGIAGRFVGRPDQAAKVAGSADSQAVLEQVPAAASGGNFPVSGVRVHRVAVTIVAAHGVKAATAAVPVTSTAAKAAMAVAGSRIVDRMTVLTTV
jgi:hypothetical protein